MRKFKRSAAIMLAMIMVIGTQSITAFADGEENAMEGLVISAENAENTENTDNMASEIADEETTALENENVETEVSDENNGNPKDESVEAYAETDGAEAYAEGEVPKSGTCGDNLTWTLSDDGILTISGNGPMRDYANGEEKEFPIVNKVESVIIENGVTSIGAYAFDGYVYMSNIVIPNSVVSIGEGAFCYCYGLTQIKMSEGLKSIGNSAFVWCNQLGKIKIPNSVTSIGDDAFSHCEGLKEVEMPNGVVEIESGAFSDCKSLMEVRLPDGINAIEEGTFYNCNGLQKILIPEKVAYIGASAFEKCQSLKAVVFKGNAPAFEEVSFLNAMAIMYYPMSNPTWTADKMQNYGGTLTWNPWNLYIVEEATDSVYVKGSSTGATIKCTEELGKFISVAVDGVIVDSSNYTVVEGSTVLTFLSSYLDTLSVGDHVVTLNYTYGSVDTSLTVLENGTNLNTPANGTNTSGNVGNANGGSNTGKNGSTQGGAPKTGDNTMVMLWLFAVLAAGSSCFILFQKRRVTQI
ncbi:MAG: leucine-rich repeat domain-containing protein [Ruminococcus sp.]|nr:leucine-rich repeat domain-containing protein [Ruminococcus sp.]